MRRVAALLPLTRPVAVATARFASLGRGDTVLLAPKAATFDASKIDFAELIAKPTDATPARKVKPAPTKKVEVTTAKKAETAAAPAPTPAAPAPTPAAKPREQKPKAAAAAKAPSRGRPKTTAPLKPVTTAVAPVKPPGRPRTRSPKPEAEKKASPTTKKRRTTTKPAAAAVPTNPIRAKDLEKLYSRLMARVTFPIPILRRAQGRHSPAKLRSEKNEMQGQLSRILSAGDKNPSDVAVAIHRTTDVKALAVSLLVEKHFKLLHDASVAKLPPPPELFQVYNSIKAGTEKWDTAELAPLREQYRAIAAATFVASCLTWMKATPERPPWLTQPAAKTGKKVVKRRQAKAKVGKKAKAPSKKKPASAKK